jgi:Protein of unknown function (DUF4012)
LKYRILLAVGGVVAVYAGLAAFVGLPVAYELAAARAAVGRDAEPLDATDLLTARSHLDRARDLLASPAGLALRLPPVLRQNLAAVEGVTDSAVDVLDASATLDRTLEQIRRQGVIENGAVQMGAVTALRRPLRRAAESLGELESSLRRHRNGWVAPPLWAALDGLLEQAESWRSSAGEAADLIDVAGPLLGADGPRDYLVLLLNNAELRGAGGILSGVGSMTIDDGQIELGDFSHYTSLSDPPPYRPVPAPADFKKHFGVYKADTTRWVATSSSPDVPDVAIVARRLFDLSTGTTVDGVVITDPRGLAALMPPDAVVRVPVVGTELTPSQVPKYVYERAYEELGGGLDVRRDSLIGVGRAALSAVLRGGLDHPELLEEAAGAVTGGHLRMVSFDPSEQRALAAAGISGELGDPRRDGALTTVQNYGGNKLDPYSERSLDHTCRVAEDGGARCRTSARIENHTPRGLTRYQYQYRPYGLFKNFVELYVPAEARLEAVETGGRDANFYPQLEDGYKAVGLYLEIPAGDQVEASVTYSLPPSDDGYSLVVSPQPLSHDAHLDVRLQAPEDWDLELPGGARRGPDGTTTYSGELEGPIKFEAGPSERTGLAAWWLMVQRFWNEPLF